MSANTDTVERYLDGFRKNDHAQILSCLTDDIEWTVFGAFHLTGKQAYDEAIEGPGWVAPPELDVVRMVEQDDVVMAELLGRVRTADGRGPAPVHGGGLRDARRPHRRAPRLGDPADGERLPLTCRCHRLRGKSRLSLSGGRNGVQAPSAIPSRSASSHSTAGL